MTEARTDRALVAATLVALAAYLGFCVASEHDALARGYAGTHTLTFALLLLCLTRRLWFSVFAAVALFGLIWIASALKFKFLEVPLIAPDLYYFINIDTVHVIGRYPALAVSSLLALVLIPLGVAWVWRRDRVSAFAGLPAARERSWRRGGIALTLIAFVLLMWPSGPYAGVYGKKLWDQITEHSYITSFVSSFHNTQIVVPPLSVNADDGSQWVATPEEANPPPPAQKPDVIAILQESTFDPMMLAVCQGRSICKRKMFEPDARTRAHGLLHVHTFGGGTWLSEFTLHTGMPHTLFGSAGHFAPYNLAPRLNFSIARAFKAAGYRVVALYPTAADFINGTNAYREYGFDKLYDGLAMGIEWGAPDNQVAELFWRLYQEEKRDHPGQPLYFFYMTIHQHGPHMKDLEKLAPPYNKPQFEPQLSEWLNLNLGNYLERNAESNAALELLEHRLLDRPDPTVIMHFGDHQPAFDGAIFNLEFRLPENWGEHTDWATYYMVRSNFEPARKYEFPVLDIAYLGSILHELASIPKDPYYAANARLRDRCHGRYEACSDPALVRSYEDYVYHRLGALNR